MMYNLCGLYFILIVASGYASLGALGLPGCAPLLAVVASTNTAAGGGRSRFVSGVCSLVLRKF